MTFPLRNLSVKSSTPELLNEVLSESDRGRMCQSSNRPCCVLICQRGDRESSRARQGHVPSSKEALTIPGAGAKKSPGHKHGEVRRSQPPEPAFAVACEMFGQTFSKGFTVSLSSRKAAFKHRMGLHKAWLSN